jgi:hypothetical protein
MGPEINTKCAGKGKQEFTEMDWKSVNHESWVNSEPQDKSRYS